MTHNNGTGKASGGNEVGDVMCHGTRRGTSTGQMRHPTGWTAQKRTVVFLPNMGQSAPFIGICIAVGVREDAQHTQQKESGYCCSQSGIRKRSTSRNTKRNAKKSRSRLSSLLKNLVNMKATTSICALRPCGQQRHGESLRLHPEATLTHPDQQFHLPINTSLLPPTAPATDVVTGIQARPLQAKQNQHLSTTQCPSPATKHAPGTRCLPTAARGSGPGQCPSCSPSSAPAWRGKGRSSATLPGVGLSEGPPP